MSKKHIGSNFDDFLREEGLLAQVEAVAIKRVLAYQIAQAMKEKGLTKVTLAKTMGSSRAQLTVFWTQRTLRSPCRPWGAPPMSLGRSLW